MNKNKTEVLKIAVPISNGILSPHFGHCEKFAILEIIDRKIVKKEELCPPFHEPGVLPKWLKEEKVNIIIAGGMGQMAQDLFAKANIKTIVGVSQKTPESIVNEYLSNNLEVGQNLCDH